jgi:hypothetical protein
LAIDPLEPVIPLREPDVCQVLDDVASDRRENARERDDLRGAHGSTESMRWRENDGISGEG